ncbi:hydrogenase iron-sulfur subunit, partial [candidate division TA06 bacterium]
EAFLSLCDGVLIMGCRKGSCNYLTGNYQAEKVAKAFRKALELISVNPERLFVNLESDTEIIQVYEKFYRKIRRMGPLWPQDDGKREELRHQFLMARATLLDEELKWLVAREWTLVSRENAYGEITSQEKFDAVLEKRIEEQFLISRICDLLKEKAWSGVEISSELGEPTELIFRTIVEMTRRGLLTRAGIKERNPLYKTA